jgi:hypothetical protein
MRTKLVALVVGLLAALTACSSSGGKGGGFVAGSGGQSNSAGGGGGSTSTPKVNLGGGGGDYCNILKSAKQTIDQLNKMNSGGSASGIELNVVQDAIHKADAAAPADIKPDWDRVRSAIDGFISALEAAGISLSDLNDPAKLQKLTPAQLQAFQNAAKQLDSPDVANSFTKVEADAKTRCGLDLNGS